MVVSQESINKAKPFMTQAIQQNNTGNIRRIFEASFPVNEPIAETGGITPLMYCCALGELDSLEEILAENPDFTIQD